MRFPHMSLSFAVLLWYWIANDRMCMLLTVYCKLLIRRYQSKITILQIWNVQLLLLRILYIFVEWLCSQRRFEDIHNDQESAGARKKVHGSYSLAEFCEFDYFPLSKITLVHYLLICFFILHGTLWSTVEILIYKLQSWLHEYLNYS